MAYKKRTQSELVKLVEALETELALTRDSDSRRQAAEAKLEESESRYRALADNLPLGLYRRTCGPEGKLVMVNPALVKMFKYDSEIELNQVPVARLYWDPSECEVFSQKLFTHREVIREEIKMKRKDGAPFWISVTTRVICDSGGAPIFFDGIMEDITEEKRRTREAELRQEQLAQADKMISLGILVSGVAHEINNPNQFIVSHLVPLRKMWEDAVPILDRYYEENGDFVLGGQRYSLRRERASEMFRNIQEGTDRIRHIVSELRDYARETPSDLSQSVALNEVVQSALALLRNLVKRSAAQFFVTYDKILPRFRGDYRQIEQVIINLVQNACQAVDREEGKISLSTYFDEGSEGVVFQVDDTGGGISKENLARVTDPFFTTKRGIGGTGLGLSISATIVARHGGRLQFESEVGEGTTVRMILPATPFRERRG